MIFYEEKKRLEAGEPVMTKFSNIYLKVDGSKVSMIQLLKVLSKTQWIVVVFSLQSIICQEYIKFPLGDFFRQDCICTDFLCKQTDFCELNIFIIFSHQILSLYPFLYAPSNFRYQVLKATHKRKSHLTKALLSIHFTKYITTKRRKRSA